MSRWTGSGSTFLSGVVTYSGFMQALHAYHDQSKQPDGSLFIVGQTVNIVAESRTFTVMAIEKRGVAFLYYESMKDPPYQESELEEV